MPKYGIHHIILSDATTQLLASQSAASQSAGADIATNRDIAMLGAIGPDLFFWAPDYDIVRKLYRLHRNIQEVVDLYNQVMQPIRDIRDAVVEPAEDAVSNLAPHTAALIQHAVEQIKETASLFESTLGTGLFAGVISGFNFLTDLGSLPTVSAALFQFFKPPLQDNEPESKWYWFDMLHYRKTGDFAHTLLAKAGTDARQRAYALGYLSHIATDLVGHAYVNQIVGGPYRMHVQRHVTVENWLDTWKFQEYYGESINLSLVEKLGLPSSLPAVIGDLLNDSLRQTYENVPHPKRLADGFLSRDQIDQTYEIFIEILTIMKNMAVHRPEEPFSGVADVLADAFKDLFQPPPSPPSFSGGSCSLGDVFSFGLTSDSRDCYQSFFDKLSDWLDYIEELLNWAFETLRDLLDVTLALLLSLPITVLLAALYAVQLLLYEIYQTARSVLALEGYVFPEPEDLSSSHGRNLTTPFHCAVAPFRYPKRTALDVSHLVCAPSQLELPVTVADFNPPLETATANRFINGVPFSLASLKRYAFSKSPDATKALERKKFNIGNATDLTDFMLTSARDLTVSDEINSIVFTDWNLDSDRGYGYKTWTGLIPSSALEAISPEDYVPG